jgi:hypothetical protein
MYIFHDRALAHAHEEMVHRLPRRNGLLLWRALYDSSLGRMGVVVTDPAISNVALETWMRLHNIRAAVYEIMDDEFGPLDQQIEGMMIKHGMRSGDMYVDTDPDMISKLLARGVPSLLLADPYVLRKEWTEQEPKDSPGWDALVAEMDRQTVLRTQREWMEE